MRRERAVWIWGVVCLLAANCGPAAEPCAPEAPACGAAPISGKADNGSFLELNLAAGKSVIYEVQARLANACHPLVGDAAQQAACQAKIAPELPYRAEGLSCGEADALAQIRLGTLEDLLQPTDDPRQAISLRYISERLGANTVWLMPLFPNNDRWALPDACDNLGSPYAVRDYLHVRGSLAQSCILQGRDESSAEPCWGNAALEELIAQAHGRGMKVLLDLAFNHFGHNYQLYDYQRFTPVRQRIAEGQDLSRLWDFDATYEAQLLAPEILDSEAALRVLAGGEQVHGQALAALEARCPDLRGDELVRAYNVWRVALDWERAQFPCQTSYLEFSAPGFYVGADRQTPSRGAGDNFSGDGYNTWNDVKFLFHHEKQVAHQHEFVRLREYLFRLMNYWVSRGVDGFRLDHTTDPFSGLDVNEWRYILSKVNYYAQKRGQGRPIYLAEEFHDQPGMNRVVDIMTEGYVSDMTGRYGQTKDAAYVERVVGNLERFAGRSYVMTALETHDERRLTDGTGLDIWTGAGFWGIGATSWSVPMLLMGQELGESERLPFRKSAWLPSRFVTEPAEQQRQQALLDYYGAMIRGRLAPANRALYASQRAFLRTREGQVDPRLFAQVKWSHEGQGINVVFTFHNLWRQAVAQSYFLPPELAGALAIDDAAGYRLVDIFSGQQLGPCRSGAELKWELYVELDARTRAEWLRLEQCR